MSRRFLLIGDVGGAETYHVGDEGMLEANLLRLRELFPEARCTVISRDPDWTAQTYGVEAIERLEFPDATTGTGPAEWRLEALLEAAESGQLPLGFERAEQAMALIAAVEETDAVLISGGGNLNATWPEHLYERLALLRLAERLKTPALVLGQTIGPELTGVQRQRLTDALSSAKLVGARETDSYRLLENFEIPREVLHYQLDDAVFLGREPAAELQGPEIEGPYLAVTLCGEIPGLEGLAHQIASLAMRMGAEVVFLPHAKEPDRDREVGERFGEALGEVAGFHLLEVLSAREVAALTGAASMVISARYHPLVFGLAAGVPSLGLFAGAYTRQKLSGALRHAGLEDWVLPIELAASGLLIKAASEMWERRTEIRRHLEELVPHWEARFEAHWQLVGAMLGRRGGKQAASVAGVEEVASLPPAGEWCEASRTYARVVAERESELVETKLHAAELKEVVSSREKEIASLQPVLERFESEVDSMRETLDHTQEEVGSLRQTLAAREKELTDLKPTLAAREKELDVLKPTLEAKEEELGSLRPTLAAREEEIGSLKPTLAAREEELMSIKPVLKAREEELTETRQSLEELRQELADCESTVTAYRNNLVARLARRLGYSPEKKRKDPGS